MTRNCDTFRDRDGDCTGESLYPVYDPWGNVYMRLCPNCKTRLDNYEPPDPDGEVFRGNEAAAYEAEQQAKIQRELK